MLMNAAIHEFVQQTPSVKTPKAATTVNAMRDTQKMAMVSARVSKFKYIALL